MSQKACSILRDALQIVPAGIETIDSPLIDVFEHKDIKCANPQIVYSEESLKGAEIMARTIRGSVCGFSKALGKGTLMHLGTWMGFDTEGHKPAYEAILRKSEAVLRQTTSSDDNITVRERFTKDKSGMLFVGNYFNEEQFGKATYTHPETGETIAIPYANNELLWPSLYAILSPVCMEVSEGLKILHSTSDILDVSETPGQLDIIVYGDRDLAGEIVFEGANVRSISEVTISKGSVDMVWVNKRLVVNYGHEHNHEMKLTIILK